MKFKKIKKTIKILLLILILLTVWQFAFKFFNVPTVLIPTPTDVYASFQEKGLRLIPQIFTTMKEITIGFIIAVVIGTLAGIGVVASIRLKGVIYPSAILMRAMPMIAIAPIIILWFGWGLVSKVMIVTLISFFPIFVNTSTGLSQVDEDSIKLMRSMNATKMQVFLKLRFPNSMRYYFTGLKSGIGNAVIGAIMAEFVAPGEGLGSVLLIAMSYFDMPYIFAIVLITFGIGLALFEFFSLAERLLLPWEEEAVI